MIEKTRKARIAILGFCCILICLNYNLSFSDNINNGYFRIITDDKNFEEIAFEYLEYYRILITELLDYDLDTTIVVNIADSERDFRLLVGKSFPDWGAGAASMETGQITIKSPKLIKTGKSFRELLGHELTHIMLYRASGKKWLPRWLHEGLAMKISGEWNIGQDILISRAAWTGRLIPLQRLESLSVFNGAEANLAYTESYTAVSMLLNDTDKYVFSSMLFYCREGNDFYRSFNLSVGVNYSQWINDYFERTKLRYQFLIFIFDSKLFWIFAPLAVILLFLYKKFQNRKTVKKWKREERFNPPDDSYKEYYDGYYDEENQV